MYKDIIKAISSETDDNFIVLSIHDDIDILADGQYKFKIEKSLKKMGFNSQVKDPQKECLYYAEHDIQFFKEDITIDLHSNLCYNGLKPNSYIPVDKLFENYCFNTKLTNSNTWKYTLSPEAEIVHLVCRIIFDKKTVPTHYKSKLKELIPKVDSKELFYAFELALFKYANHACDLVLNENFEHLPSSYVACCDY